MLLLLASLCAPASAGFFAHDSYDPPAPHFGTSTFGFGALVGYAYSPDLAAERMGRWAFQADLHGDVLLLPFIAVGGRGGYLSAATTGDDNLSGYRMGTWFVDFGPRLDTERLKLYAYWSPAARVNIKARADYHMLQGDELIEYAETDRFLAEGTGHVALGMELTAIRDRQVDADAAKAEGANFGVQLELRRSWWQDPSPNAHLWAPGEDALTVVLVSFSSHERTGKW